MRGRCKRALQLWRVLALASSSAFKHTQHPALDPVRLEHERSAQATSRRDSAARAWPEEESLERGRRDRKGFQGPHREPSRENLSEESAGACGHVGGMQGREEGCIAKRSLTLPAAGESGVDQYGWEGHKTFARGKGDTHSPEEKARSVERRHPDRSCCGTSHVCAFTATRMSLRDCARPQLPRGQAERQEQRELAKRGEDSGECAGGHRFGKALGAALAAVRQSGCKARGLWLEAEADSAREGAHGVEEQGADGCTTPRLAQTGQPCVGDARRVTEARDGVAAARKTAVDSVPSSVSTCAPHADFRWWWEDDDFETDTPPPKLRGAAAARGSTGGQGAGAYGGLKCAVKGREMCGGQEEEEEEEEEEETVVQRALADGYQTRSYLALAHSRRVAVAPHVAEPHAGGKEEAAASVRTAAEEEEEEEEEAAAARQHHLTMDTRQCDRDVEEGREWERRLSELASQRRRAFEKACNEGRADATCRAMHVEVMTEPLLLSVYLTYMYMHMYMYMYIDLTQ